ASPLIRYRFLQYSTTESVALPAASSAGTLYIPNASEISDLTAWFLPEQSWAWVASRGRNHPEPFLLRCFLHSRRDKWPCLHQSQTRSAHQARGLRRLTGLLCSRLASIHRRPLR